MATEALPRSEPYAQGAAGGNVYACIRLWRCRPGRRAAGTPYGIAPAGLPPKRAGPGVTLLELLAVVAIVGILAALTVPRLADSAAWSVRGEKCAAQVAAALKLARRLAVENGATNPTGYAVECAQASYRILNLNTGVYEPAVTLAAGWRFSVSNYRVAFDPYGGARETNGHSASLELVNLKDASLWAVNFEPATGYVWYKAR